MGTKEDIVEALVKQVEDLEPEIIVVPCSGEDALAGLRDQIFQQGPASFKQSVRTGGVDSAWLRAVRSLAKTQNKTFVIVSKDGDIAKATKAWSMNSTIYPDLFAIRHKLFRYTTATHEVVRHVIRYLSEAIESFAPGNSQSLFDGPKFADVSQLLIEEFDDYDSDESFREANVEISRLGPLVGLRVLQNDRREGSLQVEAWLAADLEIQFWFDVAVQGDMELKMRSQTLLGSVIKAEIGLQTTDEQIVTAHLDEAVTVIVESNKTDVDGALQTVTEVIGLAPGLDGEEIFEALQSNSEWVGPLIDGRELKLSVYSTDYKGVSNEQVIEARVGDKLCSVAWSCTEDYSVFDDEYIDERECIFKEDGFPLPIWKIPSWLLEMLG